MVYCFFYNTTNERVFHPPGLTKAAISIPIQRFKRTYGCTIGTGKLLKKSSKGKKFKVEILDPVVMGICTFIGFGPDAVPKSKFKDSLQKKYLIENKDLVFKKTGKNACIFVVDPEDCDVTPIAPKKK
ncbi:MAG: hypothetical protein LiPW41_693 [Parcubacteria group bacterium LiPW_41]|nr:MAG: hypothetical protein LiPW41_693 [Parcubacteria group bacterium LiPW_41]